MAFGETYEENAAREIQEEAGVKVENLEALFTFYYDGVIKVWGKAFRGYFDGGVADLKPQVEEVERVMAASLDDIQEMIGRGEKFTPDGLMALDLFK